jgi:protein SPA2
MDPFQVHHIKFAQFLGTTAIQSKTTAREKLVRLSKNQFSELSTDVYDELIRREKNVGMLE